MRNLYAVLVVVFCSISNHAQNVSFVDENFKNYLINNYTFDSDNDEVPDTFVDANHDGEIQISEATAVTNMYIYSFFRIIDISGIEAFSNLKTLNSSVSVDYSMVNALNKLETLDISFSRTGSLSLSGLPFLKTINCSYGTLSLLELSNLPSLEYLNCYNNSLATINVNGLTNLKYLNCSGNELTSLDITNLSNLIELNFGYNQFTSLDLSHNVNLENLSGAFFKGTSIDLSALSHLRTLELSSTSLTSLDISQLASLELLSCMISKDLQVLTIGNLPSLKTLSCSSCAIETMDVTGANNLEDLLCSNNKLTTLNVANKPHLKNLYCNDNRLTSLDVTTNTSLEAIKCENNLITTLDVGNLTLLENLSCSNNQIAALNTNNLVNLHWLECNDNNITALNTAALSNIYSLNCSNNPLSSGIDLSNLINLDRLYCSNNNLTSLNVAHLSNLKRLDCSKNQLTTLELPTVTYFYSNHGSSARTSFDCSDNLFSTLDFSSINSNECSIRIANNPNLTSVNIKNSRTYYNVYSLENCPNLGYICINAYPWEMTDSYNGIFSVEDIPLLANIQINPYCSFTPGGIYNTITGTFSLDIDNNGCDANDFNFSDSKILIDNAPSIFRATYTNTSGNYNFYTQQGDFVITPEFEHPYFTVSPASATINFADSNSNVRTQNFCVLPNGIHKDVEITILPLGIARPGFDVNYKLVYKNKGNQLLSGNINFTFDDAVLDFISANPTLSSQSLNTLNWSYSNLKPFESRSIEFKLNVNSPMEIPAVNNGDILSFSAAIDPVTDDETIADNSITLTQMVRGSYDPNDKICLEGNTITPEQVGGYLHYLIRFQNSGTAPAENIVVKDIIDTTKFDITSLELTSTSHAQVTKITNNQVEFQFENINLPPSSENEPASHGYVAFKIKTKADLGIGSTVTNKADIYFDYNFPIETDPATSTVALLNTQQFGNVSVNIAPNPVKNLLHIHAKENITSVQLLDLQGRILATRLFSDSKVDFDFSQQSTGVYFVKIYTDKGLKVEKVIKE